MALKNPNTAKKTYTSQSRGYSELIYYSFKPKWRVVLFFMIIKRERFEIMSQKQGKKMQTDSDIKRKAIKQVVYHIKKKASLEYVGIEHLKEWINHIEEIISNEEFVIKDYIEARRSLNDIIERTLDEEMRFKLRDSWLSFGKALEKKAKAN